MTNDISNFVGKYTMRDPSKLMEFYKVFGKAGDKAILDKIKPEDFFVTIEVSQDPGTKIITISRNFCGSFTSNSFKLGEKYAQNNFSGEYVESITTLVDGVLVDTPQGGKFKGGGGTISLEGGKLRICVKDDTGKEHFLSLPKEN